MTLREWSEHKSESRTAGLCDGCPLRKECEEVRTGAEAEAFMDHVALVVMFDLALTAVALRPQAEA